MKLLWLDLETTGLDPAKCQILEVAAMTAELASPFALLNGISTPIMPYGMVLEPGTSAINVERRWINQQSPFIQEMHTKNGLFEDCLRRGIDAADAEDLVLKLLGARYGAGTTPDVPAREDLVVLAGSSIHFDKAFIEKHMPRLATQLSHRLYDVSAVKLFAESLGMPKLPKAEAHRAADDIRESLNHALAVAVWFSNVRIDAASDAAREVDAAEARVRESFAATLEKEGAY